MHTCFGTLNWSESCCLTQPRLSIPQAIIYPLELIRTRLAVSASGTYSGMSHCVRHVLAHEGWRAFYRGMLPSMVRARDPDAAQPG